MTERKRFVLEADGGLFSHAELCRRHGVSRKTGYKWLWRYETEGPDGRSWTVGLKKSPRTFAPK